MITLHNPYSVMLDKNPQMKINRKRPVVTYKGCNVWKLSNKHFVFEKNGVVFSERVEKSYQAIEEFLSASSHTGKRMKKAHDQGLEYLANQKQEVVR